MSDQQMTGVTTRSLDTSQDIARAGAISTRSGLARMYADQFRASRSTLRRGAVVRETTGPAVPAASGDVTQTQDVSVPGSFQDVLDAAGGFQGDRQGANQVINPGGTGGYGGGLRGGVGGGSDSDRGSPGYDQNPGMQHVGPRDTSEPPPVENIDREGNGCATVVNNETGQIMQTGNCAPSLPELPPDAQGGNPSYYYTSEPYTNRNGQQVGTTYKAFDRQTSKLKVSIAVDRRNRPISRGLMDCYTGGCSQYTWFNQQFGLGISR